MRGARDALLIGFLLVATLGLGIFAARAGHVPDAMRSPTRATYERWNWMPHVSGSESAQPRARSRPARHVASAAENDPRVFLANMARAKRDGNSIGIVDDSPLPIWSDDKKSSGG